MVPSADFSPHMPEGQLPCFYYNFLTWRLNIAFFTSTHIYLILNVWVGHYHVKRVLLGYLLVASFAIETLFSIPLQNTFIFLLIQLIQKCK